MRILTFIDCAGRLGHKGRNTEQGIENKVEGTLIRFKGPYTKVCLSFLWVNQYQGIRTRMRCAYSRNMSEAGIQNKVD